MEDKQANYVLKVKVDGKKIPTPKRYVYFGWARRAAYQLSRLKGIDVEIYNELTGQIFKPSVTGYIEFNVPREA